MNGKSSEKISSIVYALNMTQLNNSSRIRAPYSWPLIAGAIFLLAACGTPPLTAAEAAVVPCKTVKQFVDKFVAKDYAGAATYAVVARDQFSEIQSKDSEFARFVVVLDQASDDAIVDDLSGYVALLQYCREKW